MRVVFVLLILFEAVNISSQTKQTKSLVSEIVDQLSLSDDLQANIFSGIYNSNDVRNVLKGNRINYKTFYYNLRSSVNEDFSNTVNYAYSRANFLFDEDEEVIYWLSEYSTYLRGLKNRISNDYSQPNYLAKNNSKAKSIRNKGIAVGLTGAGVTGGIGALKVKSILNQDYQNASSIKKTKVKKKRLLKFGAYL